jgi:hypothetical protein
MTGRGGCFGTACARSITRATVIIRIATFRRRRSYTGRLTPVRSTVASALVAGLAIGFVAVLVLMRPRPPAEAPAVPVRTAPAAATPPPAPPPDPPPEQAAFSALFDRNRSMPADPDLAAEYYQLNDQFFSNVLPPPQTRWENGLAELGAMIGEHFVVQGLTDGRMILINPAVEHDAEQRRRALCHEMVHMAVWAQDTAHGPVFQERLRQLSQRGAFKGLAATDEERDAVLERLHRDRAALDTEEKALLADRERLDRTSQAEVDAYNDRVRRQQDAAVEYNRLVAQYNLMVSYPDGLARERMQMRADGTRSDQR